MAPGPASLATLAVAAVLLCIFANTASLALPWFDVRRPAPLTLTYGVFGAVVQSPSGASAYVALRTQGRAALQDAVAAAWFNLALKDDYSADAVSYQALPGHVEQLVLAAQLLAQAVIISLFVAAHDSTLAAVLSTSVQAAMFIATCVTWRHALPGMAPGMAIQAGSTAVLVVLATVRVILALKV